MAGQGTFSPEGSQGATGRTGLWLVGAGGNVATTVAVGLAALQRGMTAPLGLTTELEPMRSLDLVGWSDLVLGGHELRTWDPGATAEGLAQEGIVAPDVVRAVKGELEAYGRAIRPGIGALHPGEEDGAARVAAVQSDLRAFAEQARCDRIVVVNLATTEPPLQAPLPDTPEGLRDAIAHGASIPASVLYAHAALDMGAAYVNFTPSPGSSPPALHALAEARRTVHAGADGKTGETLLKSALAPMYALRNLRVHSWFGQNLLGNEDGRTLTGSGGRESKVRTKTSQLPSILGYTPDAQVGIHYVPPLGDWKVAWNHITFEGFLGTRMVTQVLWHGADSTLAAPLVLDLARLVDLAARRDEVGALPYLAFFFKAPMGTDEHALQRQFDMLLAHLT